MSESMVERVARAMYDAMSAGPDGKLTPAATALGLISWEDANPLLRNSHLRLARTAVEAMREPTEGMVAAGSDGTWDHVTDRCLDAPTMTGAWRGMIDAALR